MLKTLGSLFESRPGSGEDGLGNRLPGASGAVTGPRQGSRGGAGEAGAAGLRSRGPTSLCSLLPLETGKALQRC